MRVVVLYHPKSDHVGLVEDYVRDYKQFKGVNLELMSLDTIEGDDLAKLYDITRYPAILAIGPDGVLQHVWQGELLPLMDEVSYYTQTPNDQLSPQGRTINAPSHSALVV